MLSYDELFDAQACEAVGCGITIQTNKDGVEYQEPQFDDDSIAEVSPHALIKMFQRRIHDDYRNKANAVDSAKAKMAKATSIKEQLDAGEITAEEAARQSLALQGVK